MSNDLITVIPFYTGDAIQAERLCDWIYLLNDKKASGACVLVADSEVHGELQTRVKLAADIAFQTTELVIAPKIDRIQKVDRLNNTFKTACWTIARQYRLPWMWLEPDCVPLKQGWLKEISDAYHNQPKRYMGGYLKYVPKDMPEQIVMSRIAVYPVGAGMDMDAFLGKSAPFNFIAGRNLLDRATKTTLVQQISYNHETDCDKIRPDAVVLHHDKTGNLIQHLRAKLIAGQTPDVPEPEPVPVVAPKRGRGRPPKSLQTMTQ